MAQFYAITPAILTSGKILPGTLLDSTTDAATYNAYVNAGGLVAPAAPTNTAAAALVAASQRAKGAAELELFLTMYAGYALDQGSDIGTNLAATTLGNGAALVGINDAGGLIAATTVEGALQEIANGAIALQKRTIVITEASLTDAVNGEAQVINIGAVLPANAVVIAHEVNVATLFSGGGATAVKLDVGGTTATAIVNQMDVFTGAATGALSPRTGAHAQGKFSAEQLGAKFTPDGAHSLVNLTAGSLTVTVWFTVIP